MIGRKSSRTKAQERDSQAFEERVAPYEGRIYAVCLRMMGSAADASDAMQEAMLRLWRGQAGFKEAASWSTWMYRVVVNACLDQLRKRKTQQAQSLDALREDTGFDMPDGGSSPDDHLLSEERAKALQAAMETLSPDLRTAFVLRDMQGEGYDRIADIQQASLGTVKSRIHRARLQLAKMIAGQRELFDIPSVQTVKGGEQHDL